MNSGDKMGEVKAADVHSVKWLQLILLNKVCNELSGIFKARSEQEGKYSVHEIYSKLTDKMDSIKHTVFIYLCLSLAS